MANGGWLTTEGRWRDGRESEMSDEKREITVRQE